MIRLCKKNINTHTKKTNIQALLQEAWIPSLLHLLKDEAGEGTGEQVFWGAAEGFKGVQPGEKESHHSLHHSLQPPERSWGLEFQAKSQAKGQEETATSCARTSFRLALRENFFPERRVTLAGVPREMTESPWSEVFTRCGTGGHGLLEDWEVLG